jgi:hypothetical protein
LNLTLTSKSLACLTALAVAGCAGSAGTATSRSVNAMPQVRTGTKPPPPCVPKIWATSLSPYAIYGYTAANSAPCVTLTGPYNGLNVNAPITVAVGKSPKRVYVADLGNDRILVFKYNGAFVKWWSTNYGGQLYQPWGVCVSRKGIVGVANRQFNNTGPPGNVEFFLPNAPSGSTASGDASGIFIADQFCAFDSHENFFVDGTTSGGQVIAYLAQAFVNLPGQTLVNSGLGTGSFWVGMYSRINSPTDQTLSVATSSPNSTTQTILTWKVSGPSAGPLTFSFLSTYTLTGYPSTVNAVYQVAPSAGGSTGTVYVADYGAGQTLSAPANGGATSLYNNVSSTTGVATRPTGQY